MDLKILLPAVFFSCVCASARAAESRAALHFHENIQPILSRYCFDCHGDEMNKGGVSFDDFKSDEAAVTNHDLWYMVLKNVRAGLMPPPKKSRPTSEERKRLEDWIKFEAFGIDPNHPDPGRVTIRRLNRIEYRNTIRNLLGVDFDAQTELPPDDTGYGFDNIGDVLTLSPMLLEKYLDAANAIVSRAVPMTSRVVAEKIIPGRNFGDGNGGAFTGKHRDALYLSYYQPATVSNTFVAEHAGHYQLALDLSANEMYVDGQFDYNQCRLVFKVDGSELLRQDYVREGGKPFHYEFNQDWQAGEHKLALELQPLTPDQKQIRSLSIRIDSVTVRGPQEEPYLIEPKNYRQFFPKDVPQSAADRRAYAKDMLGRFAQRAFRRPVNDDTSDRLAALAERTYGEPGKTFEAGVAQAMAAVLASPRFLFREENVEPNHAGGTEAFVDEYSLASRLSYFLWSNMPDEELMRLAGEGQLRKNLATQVKRMLADSRSQEFVRNFSGQWLQTRDIETIAIDSRAVLARERKPDPEVERLRKRFKEFVNRPEDTLTEAEKEEFKQVRMAFFKTFKRPRAELTDDLRVAMRQEAEMYFGGIVREDRNVMELIESDYDYLNEKLAQYYGLTNMDITGMDMRRVTLPSGCVRGGVLTMGSVLVATSNPTRTSAVKRGLFIFQNILGNPVPPPPPNIPALEDARKDSSDRPPTSREALAIHRSQPLCNSCHGRMDPLGLALENFNAMGMWRDKEFGEPIEVADKLITGESFKDINELKHVLATNHRIDFYRTLTEKVFTYALGRGLEYYDAETIDEIVDRLERADGRFSAILTGVIESAPFQKRRNSAGLADAQIFDQTQQQARTKSKP